MPEIKQMSDGKLTPAQAAELAVLVDLEARWENLRNAPARSPEGGGATQDLQSKQKAYEAFRAKLALYNRRYTPTHVPELLLNTPVRLGLWCRRMRDLYDQVENDPQAPCPVHLVEKAYRWADRVAARTGTQPIDRPAPPGDVRAAVRALDALCLWCDSLARPSTAGDAVPA